MRIINENLIVEMGFELPHIQFEYVRHFPIVIEHICKLYYWKQDFYNFKTWCNSLRKGFETLPKMKRNNNYPTYDDLIKIVDEDLDEVFDSSYNYTVNIVMKKEKYKHEPKFIENKNEIYKLTKEYLSFILKIMTKNKRGIFIEEVINFIKKEIKND